MFNNLIQRIEGIIGNAFQVLNIYDVNFLVINSFLKSHIYFSCFRSLKMTTVLMIPDEEIDELINHKGCSPGTLKKKEKELAAFKGFYGTNYTGEDFDDLIKDKTKLQRVMIAYLKGIRVKDKVTKELVSPKGSYLNAKMSFLKCELNRLTGMDFNNIGLFPQLAAGTTAIKRNIKAEGRADVTHHPKVPLETTRVSKDTFSNLFL